MSTKKTNLILTTCSMAWGTSYIFMKLGIEGLSPLMLMALRTGIAFLILVLIFFKRLLKVNKRLLLYSAITGFLLFTNLTPILYGLNTITASQSGFILSTTVVLVPVIHAVISRRLPEHHVRLGIIIVLIGMVLINGGDIFAVKPGTLLCMLSAFSYSINIVLNSYFTRQVDPLALGVYQQGFTCLYSIIGLLVFGSPIFPSTALDWISVLGLALLSSAYGFVVQTVVQQYTTPENTGFLFSLEPIFAAIFSFIFLHEKLTEMGYLGAIFILAGVFTAIDAKSTVMELITGKSVAEVTSKR